MTTNRRYALYDSTTGEILDIITRSDESWFGDYARPAGTGMKALPDGAYDDASHYMVIGVGDPVLTARPVIGMGSDATIDGDGSTQTIATSLPSGTKVYLDGLLLGTYSGTFTWDPTSPGDDGLHRFDFEPPFPDKIETIYITVEAP